MAIHDELTERIIGAAVDVHRTLGPGLLEQAYSRCLAWELGQRGLKVEREVALPVVYKTVRLDMGYRIDLLVDRAAIVEVKAVERLHPLHHAQLLTYLKLTGLTRGLLLNFCAPTMKDGVHRVVVGFPG
jgi:GxxExxY protein